jgi:hypothetical protein
LVENHHEHDNDALGDPLIERAHSEQVQSVAKHANQKCANQRSDHTAFASEEILAGFSSSLLEEIGRVLKTPDTSGGAQPIVT